MKHIKNRIFLIIVSLLIIFSVTSCIKAQDNKGA